MTRRHDIDALRAIAFALLILYHLGMLYVSDWDWHLKSSYLSSWLQWPMLFVNRWRMDLIFLVSGLSLAYLMKPGKLVPALRSRSKRLMIPLLFGMLCIVPIQPYAEGVSNGMVEPGFVQFLADYYSGRPWPRDAFDGWEQGFTWNHLWYLAYLWVYTLALGALIAVLGEARTHALRARASALRGFWLLVGPSLVLLVYALALQTRFPPEGDIFDDWYRHAVYFSMFAFGYLVAARMQFWDELVRLRRTSLVIALACAAVYLALVAYLPEDIALWQQVVVWAFRSVYVWAILLSILGWAHTLLNRPFAWLGWANQAVFPWYVLHQSLIVLLAFWLVPLELGSVAEPVLVLLGTVVGCWAIASLVGRMRWLRPLFGMRPAAGNPKREEVSSPVDADVPVVRASQEEQCPVMK